MSTIRFLNSQATIKAALATSLGLGAASVLAMNNKKKFYKSIRFPSKLYRHC